MMCSEFRVKVVVYTTDAQNFLLHVSASHGCHHQGVFTLVKVVLLKWSVVCTAVTHVHAC
jgi:hypothetical protein